MPGSRVPGGRLARTVLLLGLAVTAAGSWAARTARDDTEDKLIRQRARAAALVLSAAAPSVEVALSTTAVIGEAEGAEGAMRRALESHAGEGRRFISASVWPVGGLRPSVVIGEEPMLGRGGPEEARALFDRAVAAEGFSVLSLIDREPPRIGYAVASPEGASRFVVYAEQALPPSRTSVAQPDNAFSGLEYAVYLNAAGGGSELLVASTPDLPLSGRLAEESVEFGDGMLRLVLKPRGNLGGGLLGALPWLVLIAGAAMTVSAAVLTGRLETRRRLAERLATENAGLLAEQRSASLELQQRLLPRTLPEVPGLEILVRYVPGVAGTNVGGDWYDVVESGDRLLAMVGDVSGRGLPAASVMAAARYGTRALAPRLKGPSEVLRELNELDSADWDGHFVTALCGVIDLRAQAATFASAGHPPPLLVVGTDARYIDVPVGPPIGATAHATHEAVTVPMPPGSTLLMVTDGLFERRGEAIEDGRERLRVAASVERDSLDAVLDGLLAELVGDTSSDDTAILAIRWQS